MEEDFSAWEGRSEHRADRLDPVRANGLLAALGHAARIAEGASLPLLHHWLYFWEIRSPDQLGHDGHPTRGSFLPPVPLPRRMWAGGRLRFLRPLLVGEKVERVSTILKVATKRGRSGDLVFVTVGHDIVGEQGPAILEQQDIVYHGIVPVSTPAPSGEDEASSAAAWEDELLPNAVLLFRYSALTMNGHRIHYDQPYATAEEGYPGLVVHGPLQATMLADLAARHVQSPVSEFAYRGIAPAVNGAALNIRGAPIADGARLWIQQGRTTTMRATVSGT